MKYFLLSSFLIFGSASYGIAADTTTDPSARPPYYAKSTVPFGRDKKLTDGAKPKKPVKEKNTSTPIVTPVTKNTHVGITVGFGGSTYYGANALNAGAILGFSCRSFYRFDLSEGSKLQFEIAYTGKGSSNSASSSWDSHTYLEFPLSLMLRIQDENYGYFGFAPGIHISSYRSFQGGPSGNLTGISPFEFSGFIGGQFMLFKAFGQDIFTDIRGQAALTNIADDSSVDIRNIGFLISLGYCFR